MELQEVFKKIIKMWFGGKVAHEIVWENLAKWEIPERISFWIYAEISGKGTVSIFDETPH